MQSKTKNIIRKLIYFILFCLMIYAFIYLGDKYITKNTEKKETITNYYNDINNDKIEIVYGTKLINLLKNGTNIIIIGSKTSSWSEKFVSIINETIIDLDINKVYYYDLNYDKSQKNSNYYDIRELLKGNLTTTDGSENNLLAPSLYIIENGTVKYYNTETVAMKNTTTTNEYWTEERITIFKNEIKENINKYYLNN